MGDRGRQWGACIRAMGARRVVIIVMGIINIIIMVIMEVGAGAGVRGGVAVVRIVIRYGEVGLFLWERILVTGSSE